MDKIYLTAALIAAVVAASLGAGDSPTRAQDDAQLSSIVSIGAHDIGGVVTSAAGPEAGVWAIAETRELGTRFAKIVVTDDGGRFVIPDLPDARYQVWVRGYGLVDSPKATSERGKLLRLTAVTLTDDRGAGFAAGAPDNGRISTWGPLGVEPRHLRKRRVHWPRTAQYDTTYDE